MYFYLKILSLLYLVFHYLWMLVYFLNLNYFNNNIHFYHHFNAQNAVSVENTSETSLFLRLVLIVDGITPIHNLQPKTMYITIFNKQNDS